MSALYARPAVTAAERQSVEAIMASTGEFLWVESEKQLDAVTAPLRLRPGVCFYFLETMTRAGVGMGLSESAGAPAGRGHVWPGASELACRSDEPPAVLRQRVTSRAAPLMPRCSRWRLMAWGPRSSDAMQPFASAPMNWAMNLALEAFSGPSALSNKRWRLSLRASNRNR